MSTKFTRLDFIKLGGLSLFSLSARPLTRLVAPSLGKATQAGLARVGADLVYLHSEPDLRSERTGRLYRDQILTLLEEQISPSGPAHNPLWFRVIGGYAHSGLLQRIAIHPRNLPVTDIPEGGILAEVTAPYTRAFRPIRPSGWQRLYRLYYQSIHWIVGLEEGPDGRPWYRLLDHLINQHYHVPAADLRPIPLETYTPISPEVPPEDKRIEISIAWQRLVAFEGRTPVYEASIASGIRSPKDLPEDVLPTDTPLGAFRIQTKMPSRHMGDGRLTDDIHAYELVGVPWTMVFTQHGIALHGTYWHSNFGVCMSRGCVNLHNDDALWLFRWTTPVFDPSSWYSRAAGTLIRIT
jgi:hypothetical protein